MISSFLSSSSWNEFFHSRIRITSSSPSSSCNNSTSTSYSNSNTINTTTKQNEPRTTTRYTNQNTTFQFIRYLRIVYGLCILYDRIILSFDFNMFFLYPTNKSLSSLEEVGPLFPCQQYLIPVSLTATYPIVDTELPYSPLCSLTALLPFYYHNTIYYIFHIMSIINAVLFICNIYPKIQLLLLHVNMISFHFHSLLIWDGEDVMFKIWNFLFLFLPLQPPPPPPPPKVAISTSSNTVSKVKKDDDDYVETKQQSTDSTDVTITTTKTTSYPIWPIRLFQIELCCIYAGAGYAKLSTDTWRSGNALYHVIHEKDFFGGPYVPEFIFHKYGPLKLATWSSLFLECSCIFLVWSRNKYIKYGIVYSMIALHLGIESTMNMHVFEILSIIGWCMFFIEPDLSYKEYNNNNNNNNQSNNIEIKTTRNKSTLRYIQDTSYTMFINIFLCLFSTILILDTFPLYEIHVILDWLIRQPLLLLLPTITSISKLSFVSRMVSTITSIQTNLLYLNDIRRQYFFNYIMKYLYTFGLYQSVWNLYSGAPDTSCIFTTNITTYSIVRNGSSSMHHELNSYSYVSPDWGTMAWYTKKRYQRPMTMQEKLESTMCRDCYVRYQANNIMNDVLSNDNTNVTNIHLASAMLSAKCENPPLPPSHDDWFNWSGWFYADAKQDVLIQHDPVLLYATNICDDLNVELCQQYSNHGLCRKAHENYAYRHSFRNGTLRTDNDSFLYNITQTCRRSCNLCPEDGYDANRLKNGTRITIYWPMPLWDNNDQRYHYNEASIYYDSTIIQVIDRPIKKYLVKYDDSFYNNEWYDPMTLRDRGYLFIPEMDDEDFVDVSSEPDDVGDIDDDDDANIKDSNSYKDEL